jgi:hypothetical protein
MRTEHCTRGPSSQRSALTIAIERGEWERIMLHMFVGIAEALRSRPQATIDDLLTLLESRGDADDN